MHHNKTREGLNSENMESACGAGIVALIARRRRALGDGVDEARREVQCPGVRQCQAANLQPR